MLNIGVVGAVGRGASFSAALKAGGEACVRAVCDVNAAELDAARAAFGADEQYTDYEEMLDRAKLDAVIIATPMHLHASQAIAALERGISVLSEVTPAVSIDECKALVKACSESTALYMLAENMNYYRPNVIVNELIKRGMFGDTYYAEGAYLHELKALNEKTRWRRKWQTGVNGLTYGTHSLGPILQWMNHDRIMSVSCLGSGNHYTDSAARTYELEDTVIMLGRTRRGALVQVRLDMLSNRPSTGCTYGVQGTQGCYESFGTDPENAGKGRVWLKGAHEPETWSDINDYQDYLPDAWKQLSETAADAGHWGGDYFVVKDFIDAITGKIPCPIGIHEAMDMTLPGLVSQQSIQQDGEWLEVPDSRDWLPINRNST